MSKLKCIGPFCRHLLLVILATQKPKSYNLTISTVNPTWIILSNCPRVLRLSSQPPTPLVGQITRLSHQPFTVPCQANNHIPYARTADCTKGVIVVMDHAASSVMIPRYAFIRSFLGCYLYREPTSPTQRTVE
jgi:hypothetical protein